MFTDAEGLAYNNLIQEINLEWKPNFSKIKNGYPHSTLSKAFSASRATTTSGVLDVGENMISNSLLVFKKECLPDMKSVWSNEIMDDITRWRRRARTFASILQSTFKSKIGLWLLHKVGSLSFFKSKEMEATDSVAGR